MKSSLMAAVAASVLMVGTVAAQAPSGPVTPAPAVAAPAPAATAAVRPGDKLICRSERVTGTRNAKRVCRTAEQIEADRKAAREFTEMGQRKPSAETGGG
ncbi:hypothetical protein [Lysobacter humi (ex Lee et al. 2017)]